MSFTPQQPPASFTPEQREYLMRMFTALSHIQNGAVPVVDKLPQKVQGFVHFSIAIAPAVPESGLYYGYNGTWHPIL
jgi:hypothetical protein